MEAGECQAVLVLISLESDLKQLLNPIQHLPKRELQLQNIPLKHRDSFIILKHKSSKSYWVHAALPVLFVHLGFGEKSSNFGETSRGSRAVMPVSACKNVNLLTARFSLPGKVPCVQDPPWSMRQCGCNVNFCCEHTVSVSQPKTVSLSACWASTHSVTTFKR